MSEFDTWYADYEKKREVKGWMPLEKHVVARMREAWEAGRAALRAFQEDQKKEADKYRGLVSGTVF